MTHDVSNEEVEALRAKWGIVDREEVIRPPVIALPAKVLVRKERVWGSAGMHHRWFFIPVDAEGIRSPPFSTTHDGLAMQEVKRYEKLGIPMEVIKEVEFE